MHAEPFSVTHRHDCPVCGGKVNQTLLSRPFCHASVREFLELYYQGRVPQTVIEAGGYELVKCSACSFIWQATILGESLLKELYEHWIDSNDSLRKKLEAGGGLFKQYALEAERIATMVGKPPRETRVLDFGMGWGFWCRMAVAFNYDVVGLDMSQERVAFAESMGIRAVRSLSDLADQSFDFIQCCQVMEHVPEPRVVLHSLVDLLQDGGVMHIAVPDGAGIEESLSADDWCASKDAVQPLEHINCFSHETLKRLATGAGLQLASLPRVERPDPARASVIRRVAGSLLRRWPLSLRSVPVRFGTSLYFRKV